jgi:uncharacterized protein (DUF2336 family)
MNPALSLTGLEHVAAGEETPRRASILSALTSQYLDLEPRLTDRHIELYDNVFKLLVAGIELQARVMLAEKLAPLKRAPRETIRNLALDPSPAVAGPVLEQSGALSEEDLIAAAQAGVEGHRIALAKRVALQPNVADVLVSRREQSVCVALIGNGSAQLSSDGAGVLADIAKGNMVVTQALAARLRLPAQAVMQMLDAARSVVVETLARTEPDAVARDLTEAVDSAVSVVRDLPQVDSRPLNDQQIVTLYVMKAHDEVERALSRRTQLPAELVGEALVAENVDALLIVLKVAQFSRAHAEGMLCAKLGVPIGSRMLREPLDQLDRINARDPARMIKFVLQRESIKRA